ncbi:T9SS type A sorting domain-containing protein [Larkinella insperata]|uniref:T9SS type A sorting domain-containing protein n=1 Tax=Larkinella insperata TaxID=332158 RepID=A0ABW3Q4B9_9BACT|nr:T9SS type A sorting domain-containing protein [Larkinella insperata]
MKLDFKRLWRIVLLVAISFAATKAQTVPIDTIAPVDTTIQAALVTSDMAGSFCAGSRVEFEFVTKGTYPAGEQFKILLTDSLGNYTQDLVITSAQSPISIQLPLNFPGGLYFFQVASNLTGILSNKSKIYISALPTLTISGTSTVLAGTPSAVELSFTGTPPFTVDFVDYKPNLSPAYSRSITAMDYQLVIDPTVYSSVTYDKNYIKSFKDGQCGLSPFINGFSQILVSALTITTGTLDQAYCPGSVLSVPFTIDSPLPADALFQLELSDGNGNFQNGKVISSGSRTSPITATLPTTLEVGAYRIRVVVQKSAGGVDYSEMVTPVSSSLSISRPEAPEVSDVFFCPGSKMSPLTAVGVNLKWFTEGLTQPLAGAPTPPNDRSTRYFVSQTVVGCESVYATLNVIPKDVPPAPDVENVSLCQGTQGQFTVAIPEALWYTSKTGGIGATQPPLVDNQNPGDQIFYVTQTVGGCESPRAMVKATVFPIPPAPSVQTPAPLCQYATTAKPLVATGQNLTWYDRLGKLAEAPIPPTLLSGTVSFSVSQRVNGCESPLASIEQVIRSAPDKPTTSSVQYCVGDVPRSLTANGSNLRWYVSADGGVGSSSSPAFFTEQASTFTFYVTQTDNFTCESQREPVVVTVVSAPSAPTVTPSQVVCQFTKMEPLTAFPSMGLIWQGSGINGTTEVAPIPTTTEPATFTYTVSQKAGSCTSPASVITFTVRKIPDAPKVISPVAFCIGQTNTELSAQAEGKLTWYTDAAHSAPSFLQVFANTEKASITTYFVTQTDNYACESPSSTLEVRVSAKATARLSGDGDIYAGDSTAIRVRLTGDGPWKFTNWLGQEIIARAGDSLYVKWERPTSTRTYSISNLSSTCGVGDILNSYTLFVRTPLSAQPLTEPVLLKAYPNPSTGDVFVDWSLPTRQLVNFQLINAEGKIVKQIESQSVSGLQKEHFQLQGLPAGKYFLKVTTPKNGIITRSLLKE